MMDNDDELSGRGSPAAAFDAFDFDADFDADWEEILAEVDPSLPFNDDMGEEAESIGDSPEESTDEDRAAAISGGRSGGREPGNGGYAIEVGGGFKFGSGGGSLKGTADSGHSLAVAAPFCALSAAGVAFVAPTRVSESSSSSGSSNIIGAGSTPPSGAVSLSTGLRTNQESLQKLLENVKAPPHAFNIETNHICVLILNHEDLNLWESSESLHCYESYNGNKELCALNFALPFFRAHTLSLTAPISFTQRGYATIKILRPRGCGCSRERLVSHSKTSNTKMVALRNGILISNWASLSSYRAPLMTPFQKENKP
jgi:hypothetical protein